MRQDDAIADGELGSSPQEQLHAYLRSLDAKAEGLPKAYRRLLSRALRHYGIESLDRTPALEAACYRLFLGLQRAGAVQGAVLAILDRRLELVDTLAGVAGPDFRQALDRLAAATGGRDPVIADLARQVRFAYFDDPVIAAARAEVYAAADADLEALEQDPGRADRDARLAALVACPRPLAPTLARRMAYAPPAAQRVLLEALARRYYRLRALEPFAETTVDGHRLVTARYRHEGPPRNLATCFVDLAELPGALRSVAAWATALPAGELAVADFYSHTEDAARPAEFAERVRGLLAGVALPPCMHRVVVAATAPGAGRALSSMATLTFRPGDGGLVEDAVLRGLHPMMSHRLQLARLSQFALDRLPGAEDVYLFHGVARTNPADERLFALAEVRDLTPLRDADGRVAALPELERMIVTALEGIRRFQAHRKPSRRLQWNRIHLHVWPTIDLTLAEIREIGVRMAPSMAGLGVEMVLIRGRLREADGTERDRVLRLFAPAGQGVVVEIDAPPSEPLQPLDEGTLRIVTARRRGLLHPAEIVKLLAPGGDKRAEPGQPAGAFVELDLDEHERLVPVDRPPATNPAGIVVGLLRNFTDRHPEGMTRVTLMGDPTRALGALAEPECRRIMAALGLAEELGVPLEWFSLSSGARIAMDSGTENMDWIAAVLRRIVEFTQAGGEINVVVAGINVGAQPYWNAEATMLMHTRGILVMTPASAMVLTGKLSLDYSGGVSAEDNFGIGGYDRIMGPNGQAQYWAPDLAAACRILLDYYEHAYVAPGERFPRRARTTDPIDRDVRRRAARRAGQRPGLRRRRALGRLQPRAQEAVRHPLGDGRRDRRGPSPARALGRDARRGGRSRLGRPPRRLAGRRDRHRVARALPPRRDPRRRPRAVDFGDAVPARGEEDRARDQRRQRAPAARGARQPGGLRRVAGVDARVAARVRRRDRARHRELRRADRLLRRFALPRRRLRGLLPAPERGAGGGRPGGRACVGDRRRARRRGRVRARRRADCPARRSHRRARRAHRTRRRRRAPAPAG